MNCLQRKKLAFMNIVNQIKGFVRTVFGVPPLALPDCVGDNLLNYTIEGNSAQNGTPTPDTPVDIESVGEKSKNLFDVDAFVKLEGNEEYYGLNSEGEFIQLKSDYRSSIPTFMTLQAGTYTVSNFDKVKFRLENKTTGTVLMSNTIIGNYFTLTETSEIAFKWWYEPGTVLNKPMLQEGAVATEYEPYGKYKIPIVVTNEKGESESTVIYLNEPLRKVGDVSDYIDFENGKVVRNIKTQYLDPSYNSINKYTWVNKVGVYFGFYLDNNYERIPGLSNRNADFTANLQATTSMWLGIKNKNFFWIGILDYLGFADDDTSTAIDKFRVWLADNPTYVHYPTSTPIEGPITLPNIPTLKGSTVLSPGTTIQPSNMSTTYYSTQKGE